MNIKINIKWDGQVYPLWEYYTNDNDWYNIEIYIFGLCLEIDCTIRK